MAKVKYLATGVLALGLASNLNAQDSKTNGTIMYDLDKNSNEVVLKKNKLEKNFSNTKLRLNAGAGIYLTKPETYFVELNPQINIGKDFWTGIYAKAVTKANDFSEDVEIDRTQIMSDWYSETERHTSQLFKTNNPIEAGVNLSKGLGRFFEVGLSTGIRYQKESLTKQISRFDRTINDGVLIEEKPFYLPSTKTNSDSFSPIISTELKFYPQKNIFLSGEASYNLRDKRSEIKAKIGITLGGKKRK